MTLLELISDAAAAADAGILSPSHSNLSIISNADQIFPYLQQSSEAEIPTGSKTLFKPASGWRIPDLDSDLNDLSSDFCLNLKSKLKNPRNLTKGEFVSLLNSFIQKNLFKVRVQIDLDPNPLDPEDTSFTLAAIQKCGCLISRDISSLIAEGCALFEVWDVLQGMIDQGLIGNLKSLNLVEKLAEKNQAELICLCAKKISNLRASEIHAMLKFFLSPTKDSYDSMVGMRKKWEKEALLAIEKVKDRSLPRKASSLAKEASILLMMAHDGFYASEICLHYVFGSENFDGLVLSSALSRLDGFEVLGLVRYFTKWLEKYERFPEARPSPSAGSVLGLYACESVPTLEDVVRGLRLVLDEHFSYLVLNMEFREELRKVESVVGSLALEAGLCCPVEDVVKQLKEVRKHVGV